MGIKKSKKKSLKYLIAGMISVAYVTTGLTPSYQSHANEVNEANILTKTVNFPYSTQRNQSQTITIPNLSNIVSVTTDNGEVSYTQNGNQITVSVKNGAGKEFQTGGSYTPPHTKYVDAQTSAYYNSGGYVGTLEQYVYSGSYTPPDTKYVTQEGEYPTQAQVPGSMSYYLNGYSGILSLQSVIRAPRQAQMNGGVCSTDYDTLLQDANSFSYLFTNSYFGNGYTDAYATDMYWTTDVQPHNIACGNGQIYPWVRYLSGKVNYTAFVGTYGGNVTKPASDTRTYRYRGNVTKPAEDTRTWETRYAYNVTIKYSEEPNAPIIDSDVSENDWVNRDVYFNIDDNKASGQSNLRVEYSLEGATSQEWRPYSSPVVIYKEGITTVKARVLDVNGNTSKITTRIFKIDKSGSDLDYTLSPPTWTNQDVTIQGNANDSLSGVKRVQLPDGNWVNASTFTYKVSSNSNQTFKIEDIAGNETIKNVVITNIDKEVPNAPSIDLHGVSDDWVGQDVIATITDNGDEGGSGYRIEYSLSGAITQDWRTYTSPVRVSNDGVTTIYARIVDNAGNISSVINKTMKIDQNAPNITITPNIKLLTNTDVILNVKAKDIATGVKRIQLPDGNWVNADETNYTVSENGTYTFKAQDNFGHIRSVDYVVSNIKRNVLITPIREVDLELHAEDYLSGVTDMQFRNEEGEWSSWKPYQSGMTEWVLSPVDGLKHVWVRYKDKVGNVSEPIEDIIILDMTKPIATSLVINDDAPFTKTREVKLDLRGTDAYTGVEDMYISNDNKTWTKLPYNEKVDWVLSNGDGIKTVYLKISDKAGNISDVITDTIFLDTTKPLADIVINNGDVFTPTRDVLLTLTYSDIGGSGVDKVKVIEGGREYILPAPTPDSPITIPWTLDFGVVRTVSIVVTDKAGNISNVMSDTIIVDKLTIQKFTLENVVNPLVYNKHNPFKEKVWAFEPQKMIAGGDITFSMDIKQAMEADYVSDSVDYKVEIVGDGYHKAITGAMRKAGDHYTQTVTIPKDTPQGAKVYVTATAERVLNVSPFDTQTVYFPGGEDASQKAYIGIVGGNIYDSIRFNETK